jgi:hypothetical protein
MKNFVASGFISILSLMICPAFGQNQTVSKSSFIRHAVVFKLKYVKGSAEEQDFLLAAQGLSHIPGVHRFEMLRQTGKKNTFEYCLSMEFDSNEAYGQYSASPIHATFVQTYWKRDVAEFLELDFEPIQTH